MSFAHDKVTHYAGLLERAVASGQPIDLICEIKAKLSYWQDVLWNRKPANVKVKKRGAKRAGGVKIVRKKKGA